MQTTHLDPPTIDRPRWARRPVAIPAVGRLRSILRLDSAVCVTSGVAAIALARPVADAIGVDGTGWVRAAGLFLLVYGAVLGIESRGSSRVVEVVGGLSALGDAAWLAGTIALVAAGTFSGGGNVLVLLFAVAAAGIGLAKAIALRDRDA